MIPNKQETELQDALPDCQVLIPDSFLTGTHHYLKP